MTPLGDALFRLRKLAGLSQDEAARRAGIDSAKVSRWETGAITPTEGSLSKLLPVYAADSARLQAEIDSPSPVDAKRREPAAPPAVQRAIFHRWLEGNRLLQEDPAARPPTMADLGRPYGLGPARVSDIIRSITGNPIANRRKGGARRKPCACGPDPCPKCQRRQRDRERFAARYSADPDFRRAHNARRLKQPGRDLPGPETTQ